MHVRNRTSRYHIVIQAAEKIARSNPSVAARAEEVIRLHEQKLREHGRFVREHGVDPADVADWSFHE
jgi:xylulose-5-phosphate/fructose-6-phosphate phosphoketolase